MNSGIYNELLAELFGEYALYQKMAIPQELAEEHEFDERGFNAYCQNDKKVQTFTTVIFPEPTRNYIGNQPGSLPTGIRKDYTSINFVQHYKASCNFCKNQDIHIILHVYYDTKSETGIYVRKIGQLPAIEVMPEKEIYNYLSEEDKQNYKKALTNLSHNYGIGAFAYFRRIIENEVKRVIEDLINAKVDGVEDIEKAYSKFIQDHQMANLIESIGQYLPISFKTLGDNPLKILYSQLSGGIHEFADDECLLRAKSIDNILRFVIKKINEEKSELKEVRKSMQFLRKL